MHTRWSTTPTVSSPLYRTYQITQSVLLMRYLICVVKWGANGRCGAPPQMPKQSPWSSAIEKGIDSLAVWLIPTLGQADDLTCFFTSEILQKS